MVRQVKIANMLLFPSGTGVFQGIVLFEFTGGGTDCYELVSEIGRRASPQKHTLKHCLLPEGITCNDWGSQWRWRERAVTGVQLSGLLTLVLFFFPLGWMSLCYKIKAEMEDFQHGHDLVAGLMWDSFGDRRRAQEEQRHVHPSVCVFYFELNF